MKTTVHKLKTDSDVFQSVLTGDKRFEIRLNDRNYKVGDYLLLMETQHTGAEMENDKPLIYTGLEIIVKVIYILQGRYGLRDGWCIMTIDIY